MVWFLYVYISRQNLNYATSHVSQCASHILTEYLHKLSFECQEFFKRDSKKEEDLVKFMIWNKKHVCISSQMADLYAFWKKIFFLSYMNMIYMYSQKKAYVSCCYLTWKHFTYSSSTLQGH